jgi:hypothetical protein
VDGGAGPFFGLTGAVVVAGGAGVGVGADTLRGGERGRGASWAVRLPLVALVAAALAVLGYRLLSREGTRRWGTG